MWRVRMRMRWPRFLPSVLVLLLSVSASACWSGGTDAEVDLDDRVALPAVNEGSPAGSDSPASALRVAIAPVLSPQRSAAVYADLLSYLESRLGMPIVVEQRSDYAQVNDLLRGGRVDVAFVCSRPYVEGQRQFGLELLAQPEVDGASTYYSYLIVPRESQADGLEDLRGATFAFSDPLSNSGKLVPEYHLALMGQTPETFFGRYEFTGSHDNSIIAVADGLLDGAAVDSLVYESLARSDPDVIARTRVAERWGPYGIPPVVVAPHVDADLKERVRRFFLTMDEDATGRAVLEGLDIERFVEPVDSLYDPVREMLEVVGGVRQ